MRFVTLVTIAYIAVSIMFSCSSVETQNHQHTAQLSCNLDVLQQSSGRFHAIVHLTKEIDDIAPFGGVGKVIKAMTSSQVHKRDVFILLPRYSFIEHGERFCQLDIYSGKQAEDGGSIYWLKRDGIHYLMIGAPKSCPDLWQIADSRDMYTIPKLCSSKGFHRGDRDLYFTFTAAYFMITHYKAMRTKIFNVVSFENDIFHIHSSHNAPFLSFIAPHLKKVLGEAKLVYTMHDYFDELKTSFSVKALLKYSEILLHKSLLRQDGKSRERQTQHSYLNQRSIKVLEMLIHADVITTVSEGMLIDLKALSPQFSVRLQDLRHIVRFAVTPNWINDDTLREARVKISETSPNFDKKQAKRDIIHMLGDVERDRVLKCVVLWMGRFDINKGIGFLFYIYERVCRDGCTLAIMGQHTSSIKNEKVLAKQLTLIRKSAYSISCPYILLDDLDTQKTIGSTVRAAADITIMTSAREAYGMVAAEALAYASIPVVPAVGGLVDFIKPYEEHTDDSNWNGILFKYHPDSRTFSTAINDALRKSFRLLQYLQNKPDIHFQVLKRLMASAPTSKQGELVYEAFLEQF